MLNMDMFPRSGVVWGPGEVTFIVSTSDQCGRMLSVQFPVPEGCDFNSASLSLTDWTRHADGVVEYQPYASPRLGGTHSISCASVRTLLRMLSGCIDHWPILPLEEEDAEGFGRWSERGLMLEAQGVRLECTYLVDRTWGPEPTPADLEGLHRQGGQGRGVFFTEFQSIDIQDLRTGRKFTETLTMPYSLGNTLHEALTTEHRYRRLDADAIHRHLVESMQNDLAITALWLCERTWAMEYLTPTDLLPLLRCREDMWRDLARGGLPMARHGAPKPT